MGSSLDKKTYLEILDCVEPEDRSIFEYDVEEFKDYRWAIEQMSDKDHGFSYNFNK